jgi:hypothetical protein
MVRNIVIVVWDVSRCEIVHFENTVLTVCKLKIPKKLLRS